MLLPPSCSRRWQQLLLTLTLLGCTLATHADGKPSIVTSIHPLALLVAEVAGSEIEVHTLVEAGQSPHSFQMRPSDRRRLAEADLVFWVGPSLELFLQDLLTQEGLRRKSIALAPKVLPERSGDELPSVREHHEDGHGAYGKEEDPGRAGDEHNHHHNHEQGGQDPHIWLEPGLAKQLARKIAEALKDIDGIDRARVDANLADFEIRLATVDQAIRGRLDRREPASLFTYHEAFTLFAEHYGLEIAGSLTFSPEVQPGARHLSEVRARLRAANNPCVLTEPQFSRQWWKSITQGIDLTVSQWDPLATGIEPRAGGYVQFLEGLAQAALNCGK